MAGVNMMIDENVSCPTTSVLHSATVGTAVLLLPPNHVARGTCLLWWSALVVAALGGDKPVWVQSTLWPSQ